jgi:hypothetical protein
MAMVDGGWKGEARQGVARRVPLAGWLSVFGWCPRCGKKIKVISR